MIRKALLALVLAVTPALSQQPAQQPAPAAKPAHTAAAQRPDTTKAKGHRTRRASRAKAKPAAPRDTTKP